MTPTRRVLKTRRCLVITVIEVTKQTSIFAANIGSWVVPAILARRSISSLAAAVANLATRLEARWRRYD